MIVCGAWPASASPLSDTREKAARAREQVDSRQATAQATVRRYDAAQERLAAIEAKTEANSAKLDALVARQHRLQDRLAARAKGMYRSGPLGFMEVLVDSASFDEFSNTWAMLARISKRDAVMLRDLKATRVRVAKAARALLAQQSAASAQIRELEAAKAEAERAFSRSKASFASYTGRLRDLEAQQAAARRAARERADAERNSRSRPKPIKAPPGSGEWSSAVASCYGDGFIGERMANGEVLRADSMIVAHKTLPFGTLIEFSFRGRTAVAEVTDRGPFIAGREFDLGPGTSRVLGFDGVATVQYRIIGR